MKKLTAVLLIIIFTISLSSCGKSKNLTDYGLEYEPGGFYYAYSTEGGYALYVHNDKSTALSADELTILYPYFEELKDISEFTYPYLAMMYYSNSEISVSAFLPEKSVYLCYYYSKEDNVEIQFAYSYKDDKVLGYKVIKSDYDISSDTVLENARSYYQSDLSGLQSVYNIKLKDWF